jgi:hypothetical protein
MLAPSTAQTDSLRGCVCGICVTVTVRGVCVSDCSDMATRSVRSVFMLPQHYHTNRQPEWLCVWHCEAQTRVRV